MLDIYLVHYVGHGQIGTPELLVSHEIFLGFSPKIPFPQNVWNAWEEKWDNLKRLFK